VNPAFSVIVFTTVAGAAQGLVVALAVALLAGVAIGPAFLGAALLAAIVLLAVGLGASFLHLGRPERAWRAAMMWRTSWLSREVIALPAFTGLVALWWLALRGGADPRWWALLLPLGAIAPAGRLW
jgi:DMSO reductase anchor subunit